MRYVGSKKRLAKKISEYLPDAEYYLEPFLGGANSFAEIAPRYPKPVAGELSLDLCLMWQAVRNGWEPPSVVTKEDYDALKTAKPSALRGFVGYGASFGGKWFGGYARGNAANGEPRNYAAESVRAVLKKAPCIRESSGIFHRSFEQWEPPKGCVVYCDPPYLGTLKYRNQFDHDFFWKIAHKWSENGAIVFVSEYKAPDGVECVAEFTHRQFLAGDRKETTERLFRV